MGNSVSIPEENGLNLNDFVLPTAVGAVGVPICLGQDHEDEGLDEAPDAIRKGGLAKVVESLGFDFEDAGNVNCQIVAAPAGITAVDQDDVYGYKHVRNCVEVGQICGALYRTAKDLASRKKFVLTVGGDHSVACGSISGVKAVHPNLGVIWVDAHGDCNTPETSPSQNYHGMPAAHVLGWFKKRVRGFEWMDGPTGMLAAPLKEEKLVFIGLRDIDEGEKKLLRNSKVTVFSMYDVERLGISVVMEKAIAAVGEGPLHLSFDIDGCDPVIAPGTGTRAKGGLTYRESHYICSRLAATKRLVAMDIVEVNPVIDEEVVRRSSMMALMALPAPSRPSNASTDGGTPTKRGSTYSDTAVMHGDNPNITPGTTPTVSLALELVACALGKTLV